MDRIAALDHGDVDWYGGNHSSYEEAVAAGRETLERQVRNAEQDLKRQKREAQQARERSARRSSNATRNLAGAGLARIHAGNLKRGAEVSAARTVDVHGDRVGQAQARYDQASRAAKPTNNLDLVSVAQLENALNAYQGAFVVVSHDERFLAEIGVDRWLHLSGTLRSTSDT